MGNSQLESGPQWLQPWGTDWGEDGFVRLQSLGQRWFQYVQLVDWLWLEVILPKLSRIVNIVTTQWGTYHPTSIINEMGCFFVYGSTGNARESLALREETLAWTYCCCGCGCGCCCCCFAAKIGTFPASLGEENLQKSKDQLSWTVLILSHQLFYHVHYLSEIDRDF